MKNYLLLLALIGATALVSCNKCRECHYESDNGEVEIGELCDEDLENAEANGYSLGDTLVTIHCEEH
jgi:hypothetical protein